MKQEAFDEAARYWTERDAAAEGMEETELLAHMDGFIGKHRTCALATGAGGFVRCTPIEYNYLEGKFYLFSEGGLKFRGLKENSQVSLAIFDEYEGFGSLGGLQVQGTAELVEPASEEYYRLMDYKRIPRDTFQKMGRWMHLIRVTPTAMDYLNSALKKQGYESRQHWEK